MKLEQILTEDVSVDASIKNITDILTTQLPLLYSKLESMAEKYYENKGELGRGFNFIAGGQKSQWYQSVYIPALRPSLYNLSRHVKSSELSQYLSDSVGNNSFGGIESALIPILHNIASSKKIKILLNGVNAAIQARQKYYNLIDKLESSDIDDEPEEIKTPKTNSIGQQNIAVNDIIDDVLSRLNRNVAGEIRNSISRKDNKLQALQQELNRRGIRM